MIGKFGGERIRVWGIDEGVPTHVGMAFGGSAVAPHFSRT
jgi:hypothetical protein